MRARSWIIIAVLVVVVLAGLAGAALLAWPDVHLDSSSDALARIALPGFAGRVSTVDVRSATGKPVPVQLRQGQVWPLRRLAASERLTVQSRWCGRAGWGG